MAEGEGGAEVPKSTPEQETKAEKEITEEKQPQITWLELHDLVQPGPDSRQAVNNPWLNRLAKLLSTASPPRLTPESLQRWLDQGDEKYVAGELPEEEWAVVAGAIRKKADELAIKKAEAEPEIERLERPKSPEEAVDVFLKGVFNLHERGLRENKQWEKAGELYSEYTTLQRWVKDLPKEVQEESKKCERPEELSKLDKSLEKEYPAGVFLKEKLELFLEAMKRLHNRQIEVTRAEGGLEDLGVGKTGEAAAPILKVPFTNIRPVDWYVLIHVDELFPESTNPENKIDLKSAWESWQEIGKQPYYEQKRGEWKLKYIKIGDWQSNYKLKNLFQSERVMAEVRNKIIEEVGKKTGNIVAGIRAENLAHSILTVGLTFDMWDRERWKVKGKQNARDLIWFDWKRIHRFLNLRPAGPADTVGCYWADEKLLGKAQKEFEDRARDKRLSPAEAKRRLDYLEKIKKNKEKRVFFVRNGEPSEGTIIGDFFTSTFYEDQEGKHRLSDNKSLKEIPWLAPGRFEEETYEGYFTYSMMFAATMDNYIRKLEWKPEELKDRDFWVGLTDVTLRLDHFCPWLIARTRTHDNKPIRNEEERMAEAAWLVLKFRRILARGILWTGSYLAQPHPEKLLTVGTFSRGDVYGESLLGVIKTGPGILDAIITSGYLDEENIKEFRREIYGFNFHLKGRLKKEH